MGFTDSVDMAFMYEDNMADQMCDIIHIKYMILANAHIK